MSLRVLAISAVCVGVLGGCLTIETVQSPEADLVRQGLLDHCVVGHILVSNGSHSTKEPTREGKESKRSAALLLLQKRAVDAEQIYVYSIRETVDDWIIADVSTQNVRDNFYLHKTTGDVVCSTDEWRRVNSMNLLQNI